MNPLKTKNDHSIAQDKIGLLRILFSRSIILSTFPVTLILSAYTILVFRFDYAYPVYWMQTTPKRLFVLIVAVVIVCTVYVSRKSIADTDYFWVRRNIPSYVTGLWLLCMLLLFALLGMRTLQLFPFGYEEVLEVHYDGFHSYSLQHFAYDYAETHSHYFILYECSFDLFCERWYSTPKYGMSNVIETIDFYIENDVLYLIANGDIVEEFDI